MPGTEQPSLWINHRHQPHRQDDFTALLRIMPTFPLIGKKVPCSLLPMAPQLLLSPDVVFFFSLFHHFHLVWVLLIMLAPLKKLGPLTIYTLCTLKASLARMLKWPEVFILCLKKDLWRHDSTRALASTSPSLPCSCQVSHPCTPHAHKDQACMRTSISFTGRREYHHNQAVSVRHWGNDCWQCL